LDRRFLQEEERQSDVFGIETAIGRDDPICHGQYPADFFDMGIFLRQELPGPDR
jgi:hypothetical protein